MTGTLSPKENLLRAIAHNNPDHLPYAGEGAWQLVDCAGCRPPRDGADEWGVTWSPLPASYAAGPDEPAASYAAGMAATGVQELVDLPFPEATAPDRYRGLLDGVDATQVLVIGRHPPGPLDRLALLLGLEGALLAAVDSFVVTAAVLNRIADHHVQVARAYVAAGVGAGWLADDYAGQQGPVLSPALWRNLVLPGLARIVAVYRAAGLPVFFHTCGRAEVFVGDLLRIGVTVLNLESSACDLRVLKQSFGRNIAFYGGVSVPTMLNGSPADVRLAAQAAVRDLGREGGLVLAPDQPLAFPPDNQAAMQQVGRSVRYPLSHQSNFE